MEKFTKAFKYLIFAMFIGIITLVGFVKLVLPMAGKPEAIKIDLTKERIERGKYLANNVCVCMDCHSKRDWSKFSGPVTPGTLGMGGEEFNQQLGFPGKFYSKNITPAELKDWTDGEILRAFTCGVNKDGKALFPLMPYLSFGQLDKDDLYSIVAYIRTLPPIENEVNESEPDFFEFAAQPVEHFNRQRFRHFFSGNLNTSDVAVVTNTRLAEAERAPFRVPAWT